MTADEFEARVRELVDDARGAGMTDAVLAEVLHDVAESLRDGTQRRVAASSCPTSPIAPRFCWWAVIDAAGQGATAWKP